MLCREVEVYLDKAKGLPFFYVVGDAAFKRVLRALEEKNATVIRMSDFCSSSDRFPSIDDMIDYFRTLDVDCKDNRFVVVGLGEYLALRGEVFTQRELSRLKSVTLGNARVVLLLRGVAKQASELIRSDLRITEQNRAHISSDTRSDISILNIPPDHGGTSQVGIKHLLLAMEKGANGNLRGSTELTLENSIFTTRNLSDAFEVVQWFMRDHSLDRALGTDNQWKQFLKDYLKYDKSIDLVFKSYRINETLTQETRIDIPGVQYKDWLKFLYLKFHKDQILNLYLKLVVEDSQSSDEFRTNLTMKILEIPLEDMNFSRLYDERKKLLERYKDGDIADFVHRNGLDSNESIYRLTDSTMLERQAVVKWVTQHGITDALGYVYPALELYLKRYHFNIPKCPNMAKELTEYFDSYKRLKVTNRITDDFIERVEKVAQDHSYACLPTRENAISAIERKEGSHLYWIDALGVEYLSYLTELAESKGLTVKVDIVRADPPTITTVNSDFYNVWPADRKEKEDQLDKIKHNDYPGSSTKDKDPIHIPAELEVIEKAINSAARKLGSNECQRFIIASDHGASRLAVIKRPAVLYDTDTKGEHSGRCCVAFDGCDIPNTIEDNGYIVLCDYSRFRGGRAADVEVHGGATLEEIVVPVITLTLNETKPRVKLLDSDNITADKREGVLLTLYISHFDSPDKVRLMMGDIRYPGSKDENDNTRYSFRLKDIKRAGSYKAELFIGDDKIETITFNVKGRAAKINPDFDFGA